MNKKVQIVALLIVVCMLVCVFVACDDKNAENTGTVNNLPQITLTDGMTLDEVRVALAEVKNFRLDLFDSEGDCMAMYICENGYLYETVTDGDFSVECYEGNLVYDLWGYKDGDDSRYDYQVEELDDEGKETLEAVAAHYINVIFSDDVTVEVKDGKIIVSNEDGGVFTYYNFNNTVLPMEEYFPGYKNFGIGEYRSNVD